jgi:esterase
MIPPVIIDSCALRDANKGGFEVAENLHVKVSGEGASNLVLLHGLFGSANNLGQLARAFKDDCRVFSVDLPDHGKSAWLTDASVEAYSEAVATWLRNNDIKQCRVIGHSLGGKVAMQLALDHPSLVERLVVLDIAPVSYPSRHYNVFSALRAVLTEKVSSRVEAKAVLTPLLDEPRVVDFLLASARVGDDGTIEWRFNLEGLQSSYSKILGAISPKKTAQGVFNGPMLVLRGELSDYVFEDSGAEFSTLFSQVDVVTVSGAGHWLHQEEAEVVEKAVRQFFDAAK